MSFWGLSEISAAYQNPASTLVPVGLAPASFGQKNLVDQAYYRFGYYTSGEAASRDPGPGKLDVYEHHESTTAPHLP